MHTETSLRADALRNRIRILVAAEAVFAAKGLSASTDEIARIAGVSVGTLYRHFATKKALEDAVFAGRMQRLADRANDAAQGTDPGRAFFRLFAGMAGEDLTGRQSSDALTQAGQDAEAAAMHPDHPLHTALGRLLVHAQRSGQVRPDVDTATVVALMAGTVHALRHAGPGPHQRARTLTVVVDGLRSRPRSAGHE
jgi:AcrR family transcriptional regulator